MVEELEKDLRIKVNCAYVRSFEETCVFPHRMNT